MGLEWKRCAAGAVLLGISLLVSGCGGGGGVGGVSQAPPSSFTLSGRTLLNGAGLAAVTVTLSGAGSGSLTTTAAGTYSTSLANGSYTLTPSLPGYTFFPASQTMAVADGNASVPDFTATPASSSFTVSGRVTLSGANLPGVAVVLTGSGTGSATTDGGGSYSFPGVHSGDCTITPALAGFSFNPLSQVVTVGNGDASAPDFAATAIPPATPSTFTMSGTITLNGTGLPGVTVSISGAGVGSITTGSNGAYSFVGVRNGDYVITPSIPGYSFTPSSAAFTVHDASIPGLNFTAAAPSGGSITITF